MIMLGVFGLTKSRFQKYFKTKVFDRLMMSHLSSNSQRYLSGVNLFQDRTRARRFDNLRRPARSHWSEPVRRHWIFLVLTSHSRWF